MTQNIGNTPTRATPPLSTHAALEQLNKWRVADTALGMIYARAHHETSVWARVAVESIHDRLLICAGEQMHFALSIANANFSVEAIEHWSNPSTGTVRATIEGLQIWCVNGDWLFLTEHIAASRALSLVHYS